MFSAVGGLGVEEKGKMMKATSENNYGYNKELCGFANKLRKDRTKAESQINLNQFHPLNPPPAEDTEKKLTLIALLRKSPATRFPKGDIKTTRACV